MSGTELRVAVALKEDIESKIVLVDRSPEPMTDAIDARADFIHMPPGTPSGFPVARVFSERRTEFKTPFAEGSMADHNAALV